MAFWGRQFAVAIIYGLAYSLLRKIGFAHFVPLAGFKLGLLLLTPPRYWGALLVSETGLLAYSLWPCIAQFGWGFYLTGIFPPIGLMMLVLGIARTRLDGLSLPNFKLSSLLLVMLVVTIVLVADGLLPESFIPESLGRKPLLDLASDYFLGVYAGLLSIVPLTLKGALEWHEHQSLKAIWQANKALLQTALQTLVLVGLEVSILHYTDNPMVRVLGQVALFLPAGYFSVRWGWKGSAVAGAIVSFGIVLLMPKKFDVGTLEAQAMMCLFLTTFIVLGLQTTKLKRALEATENHLKKARLEHQLAETKLQRSSFELSFTNGELTRLHRQLLIQLDGSHNARNVEEHKIALTKTTSRLRELANALAPSMGASHPHALGEDGTIAVLLKKLGVEYQPNIQGQLSLLSKNALSMLYRLACEAVGYVLEHTPTNRMVLTTHTENDRDMLSIRLTVISNGQPIPAPDKQAVTKTLGIFDLGLEELRIRAQLFHGDVFPSTGCLQILLQQELKSTSRADG
jgi:glucose-6-phosphate-specific signal transduction histidine kinase